MFVLLCNQGYIKQPLAADDPRAVEVPDTALIGDKWSDGALSHSELTQYPPGSPTVSATAFKMLFSSSERIKARQLRATDPILDDCWDLFDSAERTNTPINLALDSVQAAIEYTLTAVQAAGVTLDVAARKAAILTGIVQ